MREARRRRRASCEIGEGREIAALAPQHGAEIARQRGIDDLKVDDLIALDEPRPGVRCKSDDFHVSCPVVEPWRLAGLFGAVEQGATLVGRWTAADFSGGFVLLESDSVTALTEFSLMWSDLMEMRIVPVIEDAQLAEVLVRTGS